MRKASKEFMIFKVVRKETISLYLNGKVEFLKTVFAFMNKYATSTVGIGFKSH